MPRQCPVLSSVDPDATWERGEKKHAAGRYSGVRFESRLPSDASPSDHLSDLLTRLDPVAAQINSICHDERINPRLWLSLHINNWNPGRASRTSTLQRLAVLGSGREIDIYTYTDSDDIGGP